MRVSLLRVLLCLLALCLFIVPVRATTHAVCVTDALQQMVCVPPVKRVVSLAPNLTELFVYVGGQSYLVAVDSASNYPEAVVNLPKVSNHQQVNLEAIVRLKPDLILAWQSGISSQSLQHLRQLGFSVYVAEPKTLNDISQLMRDFGALIGHSVAADQLALNWSQQFDSFVVGEGSPKVRVLFQFWAQPLIVLGGQHVMNELIERCGGVNVFNHLKNPAPSVSYEAAVAQMPELILTTGKPIERFSALSNWQQWPLIPAVKARNLVVLSADELVRSGPRLVQGTKALCQAIAQVRSTSGI